MKRATYRGTLEGLLKQMSPQSVWELPGSSLKGTARQLLASGQDLSVQVEYFAPYAGPLGKDWHMDRNGCIALKVR